MTTPLDRDWLLARIARMVEDDGPIDPTEDLTLYGLDSVAVMQLVAALEQHGLRIGFDELAVRATVEAWWTLIQSRAGG